MPPKFLAYLNVLCFETRCPQPDTVARLNSKYLTSQTFGLATLLCRLQPVPFYLECCSSA